MNIQAIETTYNGYRFRSRLEARWAVFFDTLGVKYEYEPEGFDLDGVRYLPDFWLPKQGCWIEIKGQEPTEDELQKAYNLVLVQRQPVFVFGGECWHTTRSYRVQPADFEKSSVDKIRLKMALMLRNEAYSKFSTSPHMPTGIWLSDSVYRGYNRDDGSHPEPYVYYKWGLNLLDKTTWAYPEYWLGCTKCQEVWLKTDEHTFCSCGGGSLKVHIDTPRLIAAYTAARQARFEHGEKPR